MNHPVIVLRLVDEQGKMLRLMAMDIDKDALPPMVEEGMVIEFPGDEEADLMVQQVVWNIEDKRFRYICFHVVEHLEDLDLLVNFYNRVGFTLEMYQPPKRRAEAPPGTTS